MPDEHTPVDSAGARLIIREAMREDDHPLFVALLGTATDLASALLLEPAIARRLTAVWIGGGAYPKGDWEFNLAQDLHAANVLFSSQAELWQVPRDVYKQMNVTLSELRWRVAGQGRIGAYLVEQMVAFNDLMGQAKGFPHGESWCLGDQPTVGVLLEDQDRRHYQWRPAPRVQQGGRYQPCPQNRPIRVYHTLDARMTLEDFYAKIALFAVQQEGRER